MIITKEGQTTLVCQTLNVTTYHRQKNVNGRGIGIHQHTNLSCNHTCTQTKRGVRTFVQYTKPKKIVITKNDENYCKHLATMLRNKKGA
jgi:hypothetical protein